MEKFCAFEARVDEAFDSSVIFFNNGEIVIYSGWTPADANLEDFRKVAVDVLGIKNPVVSMGFEQVIIRTGLTTNKQKHVVPKV